jgi:CRP/FNR family cyclic AMP-dependent transcriptional regulator
MINKATHITNILKEKLQTHIIQLSSGLREKIDLILDPLSLVLKGNKGELLELDSAQGINKKISSGECCFIPCINNRPFPESKLKVIWKKGKLYFDKQAVSLFINRREKLLSVLNKLKQYDLPYLSCFALQFNPEDNKALKLFRDFLERLDIKINMSELKELLFEEYCNLKDRNRSFYHYNFSYRLAESFSSGASMQKNLGSLLNYLRKRNSPFKMEEFDLLLADAAKLVEMEDFNRKLRIKMSAQNSISSSQNMQEETSFKIEELAWAIDDLLIARGLWGLKLIYFCMDYKNRGSIKISDSEPAAVVSKPVEKTSREIETVDLDASPVNLGFSPSFKIFDKDELLILENMGHKCMVRKDVVIYSPLQSFPYLFLIKKGEVKISRETSYAEISIARQKDEDLLGEDFFINHRAPLNKAMADTELTLYRWELEKLDALFLNNKFLLTKFYWIIWQSLARKIRKANEELGQFFQQQISATEAKGTKEVAKKGIAQDVKVAEKTKITALKLKGLSSKEMELLTSFGKEEYYHSGATIFNEGDIGDCLYIILDGNVRISKEIPGIGEEALAILQRGDYFGEMALIDDERRSADAKAHARGVTLLSLTKKNFNDIISSNIDIAAKFIHIICRILSDRLYDLHDRVCQWKIIAGNF